LNRRPLIPAKLIEDKANGPAVIVAAKREIPGLIAVDPRAARLYGPAQRLRSSRRATSGSRTTSTRRASHVSGSRWPSDRAPGCRRKYLRPKLVRNDYLGEMVEWVCEYVEQHAVFPAGVNDDQVDMTS
jgi:hypothetical protein